MKVNKQSYNASPLPPVSLVHNPKALLGEGVYWSSTRKQLFWFDIHGKKLFCHTPQTQLNEAWDLPSKAGWCCEDRFGELIIGTSEGLSLVKLQAGPSFSPLLSDEADPVRMHPRLRLNDGKADLWGRLWFGSMNDADHSRPDGALYRLEKNGELRVIERGYQVTNGPALSPDGKYLYHSDSAKLEVYRFTLDEHGEIVERILWKKFTLEDGYPDGMCCDRDGNVLICLFNGWKLICFAPDGREILSIKLPALQVTNCCFGGEDLQTLYISTAREHFTPELEQQQALAGALFQVKIPGLQGFESFRYGADCTALAQQARVQKAGL